MKRFLLVVGVAALALGCALETDPPFASTETPNASAVPLSSSDASIADIATEHASGVLADAEQTSDAPLAPPDDGFVRSRQSVLLPIEKPTPADPVNAGAAILPTAAEPGEIVEFQVAISIADGWHISGEKPGAGPSPPTRLTLDLPEGYVEEGEGNSSEAELIPTSQGASYQYRGHAKLIREVRVPDSATPGLYQIDATLDFQACDATRCLQAESLSLKATLEVLPRSERPSAP